MTTTYLHTDCERLLFRLNQAVRDRDTAEETVRILRRENARLRAELAAKKEER